MRLLADVIAALTTRVGGRDRVEHAAECTDDAARALADLGVWS